jgi:predicted metal-dependent hydrolase
MIEKTIELNKQKIIYSLMVNKRSRNIRLAIRAGGTCVVTVPRYVPQFIIDRFLISKSEWILAKIKHLSKFKPVEKKSKREKRLEYLKHKEKARQIALERLDYYNAYYGFKWNKVSIKNQKTRWGSCSRKGNLNFNYKIALLSEESADYIIVHELCHLKEMNHSRKFWDLVGKTVPNYLSIRKNLRKKGYTLD